jgi:hypothetical protein
MLVIGFPDADIVIRAYRAAPLVYHWFDLADRWQQAASSQARFCLRGGAAAPAVVTSVCATCSTSGADQRQRAAMSASQRSPRDGGHDSSARLRRRTDELHGSDAPYEKPGDADLRLETVDSDPADNARRIVDALERG